MGRKWERCRCWYGIANGWEKLIGGVGERVCVCACVEGIVKFEGAV